MVNINKLKLTSLQERILRIMYTYSGTVLTARKIAQSLNVSPPAISKALPLLQKEEIIDITKDEETKRLSIKLNNENKKVIQLKRADNIKQIFESGLSDFLSFKFAGSTIIVFGSYSFGEDNFKSDIDIAIIGSKQKEINLEDYNKMLNREIILNFYSSLKEIKKELRNNILSGILLNGAIDL